MTTANEMNLNASITALADKAAQMTEEEFTLFIRIMEMISGNPERRQYVMNYTGKMKELPAILAKV